MAFTCLGHICPDCHEVFDHIIYLGELCPDLKKRLRACPKCVDKAKAKLEGQGKLRFGAAE